MTADKPIMRAYWFHTMTPLHVGAGQGVGYIDLPIAREKLTGFPYVPGSAVKGVVADRFCVPSGERTNPLQIAAFGRADGDGDNANAGALVFTDARLVLMPIRSIYGTFAWCTCPMVLRRLRRDLETIFCDLPSIDFSRLKPRQVAVGRELVKDSALVDGRSNVYLEDLTLHAVDCESTRNWAAQLGRWLFDADWQSVLSDRFAVVPDDIFTFLCDTGTQVEAHVRINDEQKTAQGGQLWYEESLPAEAVLCGLVWCDRIFGAKQDASGEAINQISVTATHCDAEQRLQVGGKATVGKGQVRCVFTTAAH